MLREGVGLDDTPPPKIPSNSVTLIPPLPKASEGKRRLNSKKVFFRVQGNKRKKGLQLLKQLVFASFFFSPPWNCAHVGLHVNLGKGVAV